MFEGIHTFCLSNYFIYILPNGPKPNNEKHTHKLMKQPMCLIIEAMHLGLNTEPIGRRIVCVIIYKDVFRKTQPYYPAFTKCQTIAIDDITLALFFSGCF